MSNYNTEFDLNLQELETIEHSMLYRLKRLTTRRLTVKKDSSKEKIDVEVITLKSFNLMRFVSRLYFIVVPGQMDVFFPFPLVNTL